VFPMALYYVEVVHRCRSRRLPSTPLHAAKMLGSFVAGIRAARQNEAAGAADAAAWWFEGSYFGTLRGHRKEIL
jgi:hypothetical protein